jgi:hypothetical protein
MFPSLSSSSREWFRLRLRIAPATTVRTTAKFRNPDFVVKLILADHVQPMAPWFRQAEGTTIMGESSQDGVVLLYRPSPGSIQQSLLYEWCNLLRMYSPDAAALFLLTGALEDFVHLETGKTGAAETLIEYFRRPGARTRGFPQDRQKPRWSPQIRP